ncbi:MAG: cupredoxin domain-containing protein [Candidatus Jorgensenbacteria bacterium]|nr:cupredoxin domain-containing protein [Candidatus Jorgensenbacteria bacterium]
METFIKAVITIFFIGLVVGGIVLFSVFLIVPAERIARVGKGGTVTPSAGNTTNIEQFNETSVIEKLKAIFSGQFSQQQIPTPVTPGTSNGGQGGSVNVPAGYAPNAKISGLITASDVPADAIKLGVSSQGFIPNIIGVKAGIRVTIAVTSLDSESHLIAFESPALADVSVGIGSGQIRTVSFIAPPAGEYAFQCSVPGHASRGEVGKMIAQ